ncbi:Glycosyltransferase involved in cell wall bisynthesis [Salegentibacter salegens]|uniref:Glycosyltransferase involved in cell wall bisynthesis n=3 Tax=Salegentibacter salegens TaxID=143223 RepID=A0A1M7NK00_9FLAO|nr:glycosyltransferase family 2 protein [Salegentibacter salegens]PRX39832.1 glycosyltransferase involved in cell wall biosynthesis [Salegentibacter salegens]SHN04048.1 Glycosyltransferase involved in cell wall bisynthesis [Salegentibacter salegens]
MLSVVMPVYNGEKYLEDAIISVLKQTFTEYELLIIDDGSTDSSIQIIQAIKDPRIRLLRNVKNEGISFSRNVGLKEAKGDFLAWMDCDDLIEPNRFEVQINYLRDHPEFGICGTAQNRFGEGKPRVTREFSDPEVIKAALLFRPAIRPPTAMYRMELIREANLTYDTRLAVAEDYDFFFEASFHFPIKNLDEVLYHYRASESSIMKVYSARQESMYKFHKIIYSKAFKRMNILDLERNFDLHYICTSTQLISSLKKLSKIFDWLIFLKDKNAEVKLYDEFSFNRVLASRFFFVCKKASQIGPRTFFFYLKNKKRFPTDESFSKVRLLARCVLYHKKF